LLFVKGAVLVDTTKLTLKQMRVKLFNLVKRSLLKKYGNIQKLKFSSDKRI